MPPKRHLNWQVVDNPDLKTYVLQGLVGEDAGLDELIPEIQSPVRLDLQGIDRINSTGVREWLRFIGAIEARGPHHLARCSIPVVGQLNMIDNFKGTAVVESVLAPFFCEECEHEQTAEVPIEDKAPQLSPPVCPDCGESMSLDEDESSYFYFLSY